MSDNTEPVAGQDAKTETETNKEGRPPKLTELERQEVYDAFEKYIDEVADPRVTNFVSVNEVAIQYRVTRDNLNDWAEFSTLIKRAIAKQEDYLLENGGTGKYNPTIAIFRLKQPQHGYKDRTETDVTTNGKDIGPTLTSEQMRQLLELEVSNANKPTEPQ